MFPPSSASRYGGHSRTHGADDHAEPEATSRCVRRRYQEDRPRDPHDGPRQERERRDQRQDERRVEERQVRTARGREGARLDTGPGPPATARRRGAGSRGRRRSGSRPAAGGCRRRRTTRGWPAGRPSGGCRGWSAGHPRAQDPRAQVCRAARAPDRMRGMTVEEGTAAPPTTEGVGAGQIWAGLPLPVRRAVRDGAVVAGLLFLAYLFVVVAPVAGTVGFDAFAYWSVNPADPYQTGVGGLGAFNYTPPIARLFGPFGSLEWLTFLWLWLALLIGNVIWLGRSGRAGPVGARVPARRARALPRQHPPLDRRRDRARVPLSVDMGFRAADEGDAGDRAALVRGPAGVAGAGDRTRCDRGDRRRVPPAPTASSGPIGSRSSRRRPRAAPWRSSRSRSRSGSGCRSRPCWSSGAGATDRRWTVPVAATLALPVLWVSGFAICAALASESLWRSRRCQPVSRDHRPCRRRASSRQVPLAQLSARFARERRDALVAARRRRSAAGPVPPDLRVTPTPGPSSSTGSSSRSSQSSVGSAGSRSSSGRADCRRC